MMPGYFTIAPNHGDFQQASPEPQVSAGSPGSTSSLKVSWDTVADRAAPKILGYELQYAVAGRTGGSDDTIASWKSAEGNTHDTWDITIQVDGFDRSIGRKHMVEDGWFTLALSRAYPKPSSLPDLWLDTEPIGWNETWVDMEAKVQKTLRESRHPQYSSWTAAVVRCDETEERGGKHWAGGCRFLEYGGFTWHLRLSPPPGDASATREDFPVVTVTKETITAKWSGDGDQVVSERFGDHSQSGGEDSAHEEDLGRTNLIDPFFCQRGSCERMLEGLAAATPYLVRLRAYNRNGFGPWMSSTTDMSVGTTGGGAAGISTNTVPVTPAPKAPKLSSSTPTSLTVFVDTASTTGAAEIEAYEFEVQRHEDDGYSGDTTRWIPVSTHADDNSDAAVPLTTATELSPSSSYRFRYDGGQVVVMGTGRGSQEEWRATAEGLEAYSQHRFRVRAVNAVGAGEWSAASDWARTKGDPSTTAGVDGFEAEAVDSDIPASVLLSVSGEGQTPGHAKDFDYYHGIGVGGKVSLDGQGGDGGPGAAVIVSRIPGVPLPSRSSFFFTVLGGGGGFLQAEVKVSPGEMLEVLVGGGGGGAPGEAGGAGGFNGGQPGGSGGSGAAGGGGSTSVLRRDGKRLVAAAGGGGGAGNAENCCSEGGAGGGVRGTDGGSPALDQMVVNTGGGGECQNGWCSASEADAVSYEGIENWVTTGGSGGSTVQGGLGGKSDVFDWVDGGGGRQGAVSSPRSGESSMPIVFRGTGSRPATPGRSLTGGIGANGARGGGGGGGGFYGGGGGGSGQQGAGGGGGSSHADTGALALDHRTNEWGSGGEDGVRVVEVGESWVEVEWRAVVGAVAGEQPMFYEIGDRNSISRGPLLNECTPRQRMGMDHPTPLLAGATWARTHGSRTREDWFMGHGSGVYGGRGGRIIESPDRDEAGASLAKIGSHDGGHRRKVGSTALGDTAGGANTDDCMGGDSFSAELWEFNPSTSVWTEVLVNVDGNAPPARDGHTASVVGSKMVVFGGRGNGSDSDAQAGRGSNTALLEDEWAIDLDLSQLITISTNFSTNIREGGQIFIPLVVEQTEAQRAEADVDMCVTDLSVAVEIDHDCIQQLQLTLYGPGPPPGDTSPLGDVSRAEPAVLVLGGGISDCASDVDLFGDGNDGAAGDASYGGCVDGMDVSFEDSAESGVWEGCNNRSPLRGTFKAADRLLVGRFLRMPAEGEWTLGVLDNAVDGSNGTVTRWSLDVEIRPCDWRSALRWINVSGDARPPARARHTAAVVDGGRFVSGGTGSFGALSDLWRRGEASSEWMILAEGPGVPLASTGPYNPHGASIMVSPWGMLSIGGMLPGRGVESATGVWVLDPVSKRWHSVDGDGGVDASSPVGRQDDNPPFLFC
ncbi:conserved unknown protein [Ectocarpus siliculosus]|uniref:Fibronectin type-III domain-containing protein n=1 Tax=Ectocarpus siliculosus TaxID=2880 RepID=D8LN48_ECTSI|nr:conserved unknown protein [Ectocarpus siliculosus]|eukprot:CBN74811.1 conserved unknown protein [Ectocarpus siliculosus]